MSSNLTIGIETLSCLLLLLLLLSRVCCFNKHQNPQPSSKDLLFQQKTRLGSTPPSCLNKCNGCHPCVAVQVSSIPSHDRVQPGVAKNVNDFFDPYPSGNRYSNYKPLGWKCLCGGHFYYP